MLEQKPLISIIITNYNYGKYVSKAIKSTLSQTYKNIELIIINDGSTDNSHKVIEGLVRENPKENIVYINRENKGVVYSRNQGIEIAKGEYISYLDADDYFSRSYISKSYKIAREHDADIVYPNWHYVGEWLGRPDTDFPEFKPELLQIQKLHVTPASLIKKSIIKNHRFEVEAVGEDWDFFIGLSLEGAKFKLARDNYINYRIRSGTRGSKNHPREDTAHFVEVLEKYRKKYGNDRVIDPSKLVAYRHPNLLIRITRRGLMGVVVESIKKHGYKATILKIIKKIMSRSILTGYVLRLFRNSQYKRTIKNHRISSSKDTKLAIVVHLYYIDTWDTIKKKIANIDAPFDLFVSVQPQDADYNIDKINEYHRETNILVFPNRGRDVLPFIMIMKAIKDEGYEYVLKIHSKKSVHRKDGSEWLKSLLTELIPRDTSGIIRRLHAKDTGAIGPASHIVSLSRYMGGNKMLIGAILEKIIDRKAIDDILVNQAKYPFFGGTMFWCRTDFLNPLLVDNIISPADFNTERGQFDKTTAHALERIFGKILHKITNKRMYVISNTKISSLPEKSYKSKYKYVH